MHAAMKNLVKRKIGMLFLKEFQPKIVGVERNGASLRKPMPLYYTSLPPFSQLIFTLEIIYYSVR